MNGNREQFRNPEVREQPLSRPIEIYMVRHARQESYGGGPDTELSEEGERQAEAFACDFFDSHRNEDAVIKIKGSPVRRAAITGEIIAKVLERRIKEERLDNIKLLKTRPSERLRTTGTLDPLMRAGVAYPEALDEWLARAEKYPEARKPEEIMAQLREIVDSAQRLSKRLSQEGSKIIFIWVTHETAHGALLQKFTGKSTNELGGGIGHLEPMKIKISGDKPPIVEFREQEYKFNLEDGE